MYIREANITIDLDKDECWELAMGLRNRLYEHFKGIHIVHDIDGLLKNKETGKKIEMMTQLFYYAGYRYLVEDFYEEARKILTEKLEVPSK